MLHEHPHKRVLATRSLKGICMDTARFDGWVRDLHTRRGAMRSLVGIAVALGMTRTAEAVTCSANGSKCNPATPDTCCTATCKKHKGKFKCAPAGQAFGCTKLNDTCRPILDIQCPDNPDGVCIGGESKKSKPLCVTNPNCSFCRNDADCALVLSEPTARCIKGCPKCKAVDGSNGACVVPVPPV
jgi:hypothetical protein